MLTYENIPLGWRLSSLYHGESVSDSLLTGCQNPHQVENIASLISVQFCITFSGGMSSRSALLKPTFDLHRNGLTIFAKYILALLLELLSLYSTDEILPPQCHSSKQNLFVQFFFISLLHYSILYFILLKTGSHHKDYNYFSDDIVLMQEVCFLHKHYSLGVN